MVNEPEMLPSNFTILKASAGSGKTHALTKRYVQFLLSNKHLHNDLRKILAVTFSNNAAKEMKERILNWLKSVYFGDEKKINELLQVVGLQRDELIKDSGMLIEKILNNYSDFQIRTIDSFMATIFKSSAIDFGYPPDFEIQMSNEAILEYAFNLYLRKIKHGATECMWLEGILDILEVAQKGDSAYLWDPTRRLIDETKTLYRKISSIGKDIITKDFSDEIKGLKNEMSQVAEDIERLITESGLQRRSNSSFNSILELIRKDCYTDLMKKGITNPPVTKPKNKIEMDAYNEICDKWKRLAEMISTYKYYYACSYYHPYIEFYHEFKDLVETVKKQQAKVFIEDINKKLLDYIDDHIVPAIYFRLGEVIFHYLIDEFQDTSPIQWNILFPLIENSLSSGGSLFVVGDTKQAIYGFRNADYQIMRSLEERNPFPSTSHNVENLETNYRSHEIIIRFVKDLFQDISGKDNYKDAVNLSGLVDYKQEAKIENKNKGYVSVTICKNDEVSIPEQDKIIHLIDKLKQRGYKYRDIAILTYENKNVVNITSWLNQEGIPVISYSSLDVRKRKITLEIISLLKFLDSPVDDLSFAAFILGDMFSKCIESDRVGGKLIQPVDRKEILNFLFRNNERRPLYKAFQGEFDYLWELYFEGLFRSVGYLPLYDLVIDAFHTFHVFDIKEEESALAKILEVIKDFEQDGNNNLSDFLRLAENDNDSDKKWDIDIPVGIDAIQVMTIHASKGLEFPVVILLLYEVTSKGFDYITAEDRDGVTLLKITKNIASGNIELSDIYKREKIRDTVTKLNTLYVALTRAEAEMYLIGVSENGNRYPFDIIPGDGFSLGDLPSNSYSKECEFPEPAELLHHEMPLIMCQNTSGLSNIKEKKRGEFIHKVLYFIDYVDEDMEEKIRDAIKLANVDMQQLYDEYELLPVISKFLNNIQIRDYFIKVPDRAIKKEQEFMNDRGEVFRMDRVIIDKEKVTVIDYKTGMDTEDRHEEQIKNYMMILKQIYPDKEIEGVLAYVDLNEVRRATY